MTTGTRRARMRSTHARTSYPGAAFMPAECMMKRQYSSGSRRTRETYTTPRACATYPRALSVVSSYVARPQVLNPIIFSPCSSRQHLLIGSNMVRTHATLLLSACAARHPPLVVHPSYTRWVSYLLIPQPHGQGRRTATPVKAQAQATQLAAPLNETQSQLMIRNLLRIATYNITYLRYEFPFPNPNHITATLSPCD
jgi:hypothetical protein